MNGSAKCGHHSDRPSCQISLTINLGQSHSGLSIVQVLRQRSM